MGIFDDFGINPDEIQDSNFDIEDGTYTFEVADAEILDGTQNKPDTTFFIVDYELTDEDGNPVGSTREWFTLAEEGLADTKRVKQSLSFLKSRLNRFGVDLKAFTGSEIVGRTGTLSLITKPGKGGQSFQNINAFRADEVEEKESVKAPAKKAAPAKAEVADDDENPFG